MLDTPAIVGFVGSCEKVWERVPRGHWEEGVREMVLWRCSRYGARSGRGGLRVLQMWPKSGGVPAVLGGAMILMGRTLEKLGLQR
jgi:hypothetical protein